MKTPDSIKSISENFVDNSWKNYTIAELGQWIYLLIKRANLETNKLKASNDIMLAQNYLNMIQVHVDASFLGLDDRYKNYIMRLFQLKKDEIDQKDDDGAMSPECLEALDKMFGVRATNSHIKGEK